MQYKVLDVTSSTYRGFASKHLCDLHRNAVCRDRQSRIQVHIPLRNSVRGMAKQTGYREFGEAKIAGNASEGMAEHMRGHCLKFCFPANTVEYPDHADEMPITPIGRKDEDRTRNDGLGFDAVHRSFSKCSDLFAALRVGKANAVVASTEPRSP